MYDLSIILPCRNETANLAKVKRELMPVIEELGRTWSVELIFVDDGSSDSTGRMFEMAFRGWMFQSARRDIKVIVLSHRRRRGLGAALRTGFRASHGECVITTDSSGAYSFSSIPILLGCIKQGVDIVTASPYHPDGKVNGAPVWMMLLGRGAALCYRLLVDRQVHTYTSLFRAYRRWVIEGIEFRSDGYLASAELMVRAILDGARVDEFPTVLHQHQTSFSMAEVARMIFAHLGLMIRVLLHRLKLKSFQPLASQAR